MVARWHRFSIVGIVFLFELKAWAGTRLDWCVSELMVGRKPATLAAGDGLGGRIGLDLALLQKRLKVAHFVLRETAHLIRTLICVDSTTGELSK